MRTLSPPRTGAVMALGSMLCVQLGLAASVGLLERTDAVGVGLALGAAGCWAAYILLTQRVGDRVTGLSGLAVSLPVAALVATTVAGPGTISGVTLPLLLAGLGLAVLLPVLPFSLELL